MGNAVNPWLILAVVLAFVGQGILVGKWQHGVGRNAERVEWQAKNNKALADANKRIKELNDEARAAERAHVERIAAIGNHYAKGMRDAEELRKRDLRAARDGALVLRVPASICAGGSEAPATGPAPGGSDGAAGIELPHEVTANLFDLAHDADQVADQLRACQSVILSDRREQ